MRKTFAVVGTCLGLLLSQPGVSFAEPADAVIELSGGSIAAGIGWTWGDGTLIFQGKRYPVRVSGLSLASVGADGYTAAGVVHGLKSPQGIDGIYTAVSAEGTLAGGAGASTMHNQNGVTIDLTSTTEGLNLTLAAEGLRLTLAK